MTKKSRKSIRVTKIRLKLLKIRVYKCNKCYKCKHYANKWHKLVQIGVYFGRGGVARSSSPRFASSTGGFIARYWLSQSGSLAPSSHSSLPTLSRSVALAPSLRSRSLACARSLLQLIKSNKSDKIKIHL